MHLTEENQPRPTDEHPALTAPTPVALLALQQRVGLEQAIVPELRVPAHAQLFVPRLFGR